MQVSQLIAELQSILDWEGDINVKIAQDIGWGGCLAVPPEISVGLDSFSRETYPKQREELANDSQNPEKEFYAESCVYLVMDGYSASFPRLDDATEEYD
jgi:hypothetical protein